MTKTDEKATLDRLMKFFDYEHLPPHLAVISAKFHTLACEICFSIKAGPERTVTMRKLLESKDAAVRAKLHPGG